MYADPREEAIICPSCKKPIAVGISINAFEEQYPTKGESDSPGAVNTPSVPVSPIEDFDIDSSGKLIKYKGKSATVSIPPHVAIIGAKAFSKNETLTEVIIPVGVTVIEKEAFDNCKKLKSVRNAGGVQKIDKYAFYNCNALADIVFPDTLTHIDYGAFYYCTSLVSVSLPESVKHIEKNAFSDCSKLKDVTLPAGLTHVESAVFNNCTLLESIRIANGNGARYRTLHNCLIDTLDKKLIAGCKSSLIPTDGSVTAIAESAFYGSGLTSITLPSAVTEIGAYAFYSCKYLKSITLKDGIKKIRDWAFGFCQALTEIKFPSTVASIGIGTLSYCPKLSRISVDAGNLNYHSVNNCLIERATKTLLSGCGSSVIPNNAELRRIGNYAFSKSPITSVTIPDTVTQIGASAFSGCEQLQSITLHDGITLIENSAFQYCSKLLSVTLPARLEKIESWTFNSCSSLKSITLPQTLQCLADYCFYNCKKLTSVTIPSRVSRIGKAAFQLCPSLQSIFCDAPYGWRQDGKSIILSNPTETAQKLRAGGAEITKAN